MVNLIVSDMDETFLRANKTFQKDKAEELIQQLFDKGVVFAIASGNSVPLLESYFSHDLLKNIYLAGDDGNVLKGKEGIERTLPINSEDAHAIYDFIVNKEGYYPIFSTGEQAYVKGPLDAEGDRQISLYYEGYKLIDAFSEIPQDEPIVKIEMYCERSLNEIKEVMQQIEANFPGVSSVTSGEEWLDVYHKDGGKGEAVKYLQDKYDITPEETMCFGDSLNDLSMMKEAHYNMAMKNADPDLKKYCHYEIGNNEDQSVLQVLEQLVHASDLAFLENYKK